MAQVNTSKVTDRRSIRYQSIDDLLADIDRVVASDRVGTLRRAGNWTAGQIMGHVAAWSNYSYEGFPVKPPWFIKLILRWKRKKYLREGMPSGVRIPGVAEGTFATEALSTEEGAARLRAAMQRLKKGEPAKFPSPAFGDMPLDERIAFNLRHAELHMSFLQP